MFTPPFSASLGCDAAVIILYLRHPSHFGGTASLVAENGTGFGSQMVDAVWLALFRMVVLLPHVLPFLRRRRLTWPSLRKAWAVGNGCFLAVKGISLIIIPPPTAALMWWTLIALSSLSVASQVVCLNHLRSSQPIPRYKTIFMGSRLSTRLLGDETQEPYNHHYYYYDGVKGDEESQCNEQDGHRGGLSNPDAHDSLDDKKVTSGRPQGCGGELDEFERGSEREEPKGEEEGSSETAGLLQRHGGLPMKKQRGQGQG
ncbi:unnamed protein product, partial [Discosporangium mesarthrocarpum]